MEQQLSIITISVFAIALAIAHLICLWRAILWLMEHNNPEEQRDHEASSALSIMGIRPPTQTTELVKESTRNNEHEHIWAEISPPRGQKTFIPDSEGSWYATYIDWHECSKCGKVIKSKTHALI